jgi:hypothetical protein
MSHSKPNILYHCNITEIKTVTNLLEKIRLMWERSRQPFSRQRNYIQEKRTQITVIMRTSAYPWFHFSVMRSISILSVAVREAAAHAQWVQCALFVSSHDLRIFKIDSNSEECKPCIGQEPSLHYLIKQRSQLSIKSETTKWFHCDLTEYPQPRYGPVRETANVTLNE